MATQTLGRGFSIRAVLIAVSLGALALGCGRTPLHRCDLVGCPPPTICIDAGTIIGDAGSDMFFCTLPDGGRPCAGLGQECSSPAATCCAGTSCNSSGLCVDAPDAGPSCVASGGACTTETTCCSMMSCVVETPSGASVCP